MKCGKNRASNPIPLPISFLKVQPLAQDFDRYGRGILRYCTFVSQDVLLGLPFDELSWDYSPAEDDPDCFDCFWLEFDAEDGDGGSSAQRLQIFSKQVNHYRSRARIKTVQTTQ